MNKNRKLKFCKRFVHLQQQLIQFDGRPYLPAIYAVADRNLVVRASRQVEKSTLLVNTIVFEACTRPGIQILFVCPRVEQAQVFSHSRLLPAIEESPLIRRALLGSRGKLNVMDLRFRNRSRVYLRAAFRSADAARGISADLLLVDEFQDLAAGDLPVLQETLSHAQNPRTIITGTPKLIDNHLEGVYRQSTAHEWTVTCAACGSEAILDERCLGAAGVECPDCQAPLDPASGSWRARNPEARWGEGYWINHLMVPWLHYDGILERLHSYDLAKFKNEALGLPTTIGEHIVTREELEACCTDLPMARWLPDVPPEASQRLVAGIDWGGGAHSRTVVVIGYMRRDHVFHILRMQRFQANEDPNRVLEQVAQLCEVFQVRWLAADGGGNGHVCNRLLLDRLGRDQGLYAILYSAAEQQPRQEGILSKWTVGRSVSIGNLFSRVKRRKLLFPCVPHAGSYLEEFACELAEYDEVNRTVKYTHPETQPDDALHAANYALLVGTLTFKAPGADA